MPQTLNTCHWSNLNAFFPVKINKMWNFCLKLWFFRNHLSQKPETCDIGFSMPWTLNMHHSSHFDAFCPVKINKMWNFGCFPEFPLTKNCKKYQFAWGKHVCKCLQICTYRFLGMPIAMHYVRTLCDKYFLSYYVFSAFFMGRSRYWVLKHGVGVKWDLRRTAAYVSSHSHGLNPIFCYVPPKIVTFHEPLIIETCNKCCWIRHGLNPKYMPLKQFQCIFPSQNQQNVKFLPEIVIFQEPFITETWNLWHWVQYALNPKYASLKPFWCILPSQNQQNVKFWLFSGTPPDQKLQKTSICMGKTCLQMLANLHI